MKQKMTDLPETRLHQMPPSTTVERDPWQIWHQKTLGANLQLPLFSRHPYGATGPYGYHLIQNGI